MATDFDFDGTFDDDAADDEGFDEEGFDEEGEEEPSGRQNRLRLILLVLFIVVLLCGICYFVSQSGLLGFIPGIGSPAPAPAPATDTPAPAPTEETPSPEPEEPTVEAPTEEPTVVVEPTDESSLPTDEPTEEATAEPTVVVEPTDESSVPTEESTEEPTTEPTVVVVEPTEEPTLVTEPTDDTVSEHDAEPVPTATTVVVPGPTATPGPTVVVTVTTCDNNTPPVADANGPYTAMMGKGQAIVTFDGSNSTDSDGEIVSYEWDFDDGSAPDSGESVIHAYSSTGSFLVTLIVTDDCGDSSLATAEVTIAGPTPPAGTGTPVVPTPSPEPPPLGTFGFCYRVQYGDTLSGLAWRFGVSWQDLAYVNKVGMGYFVIAGQGVFIPTGPITDGPNVYEVQDGDTLNSVAYHCGLTAATVARANGLNLDESLSPGQVLMIPPWKYR